MEIDWRKDYQGEFVCPRCYEGSLRLSGKNANQKQMFRCPKCRLNIVESYQLKLPDPNHQVNWRGDYHIGEFACPNPDCNSRDIRLHGTYPKNRKKRLFRCKVCGAMTFNSIDFTSKNIRRYGERALLVKPFSFEDDNWDLRALVSFDKRDNRFMANFEEIQPDWFRFLVKQYIYHLCKLNTPLSSIDKYLPNLRIFSRYLAQKHISSIKEINRSLILDFIAWNQTGREGLRSRLGTLRDFFWTGTLQGWFDLDQDLIRPSDFPKKKAANPDPIPDNVREQIEQNLHQLPDPIARMWIISFFTAMRPSELALLKKDCLVQEGSNWKIVWWRKKTKDWHEIPVTRIIAKVVQEQQEYIDQLWGDGWDYLFCHYQGLSQTDPSQPNIKPVKKIFLKDHNPFVSAIRCLIKAFDLRDDNGELAFFQHCLTRPTRLTQLFEQGHDLAVVSAWAGHRKLATTSTYYTHVSCDQIEKETEHIQKALFNADGKPLHYESLPKSFWKNPRAHQLELSGDHINTPIYGYCGLPLEQRCDKFRACYTCRCFMAVPEKLTQYIKTRDELRGKESRAKANGQDVLVEQFGRQADQLDKIIASLEDAA